MYCRCLVKASCLSVPNIELCDSALCVLIQSQETLALGNTCFLCWIICFVWYSSLNDRRKHKLLDCTQNFQTALAWSDHFKSTSYIRMTATFLLCSGKYALASEENETTHSLSGVWGIASSFTKCDAFRFRTIWVRMGLPESCSVNQTTRTCQWLRMVRLGISSDWPWVGLMNRTGTSKNLSDCIRFSQVGTLLGFAKHPPNDKIIQRIWQKQRTHILPALCLFANYCDKVTSHFRFAVAGPSGCWKHLPQTRFV